MLMNKSKLDFLKQVKFDYNKYNNFLKKMCDDTEVGIMDNYDYLISQNAHNSGKYITLNELENFCEKIYIDLYDYVTNLPKNTIKKEFLNGYKKLTTQDEYKIHSVRQSGFYNFFYDTMDKEFSSSTDTPFPISVDIQGAYAKVIDGKLYLGDGFLHCWSPSGVGKAQVRLYINLLGQNILPFANAFVDKCKENELKYYFKMTSNDLRNDTFLVYTSYENVQKFVDIIEEIRRESPKLLEGTELMNPLLGCINGYIGVGEEPQYKHSSFNSERANLVKMCYIERFKVISNYINTKPTVKNAQGELLTMDEFLSDLIKKEWGKAINKDLEFYKLNENENGAKNAQNVLNLLTNSNYFDSNLNKAVENFKEILRDNSYYKNIKIETSVLDNSNEDDNKKLKYKKMKFFVITNNVLNEIYSYCKLNNVLYDRVRNKNVQKEYFEDRHISTLLPFVNSETENEIIDYIKAKESSNGD